MTKTKIILSTLAILSLGILTACESTPEDNQMEVIPNTTNNNQTTATTSANQEVITPPVTVSADQAAYDSAIQLVDASFCKKISDSAIMGSCERDVSTISTFKQALDSQDAGVCSRLTDPDQKNSCEIQIEAALKAKAAKEELTKQGEADVKKAAEILQAGDYTRCAELTLDTSKKDCETNVLVKKAQETSDSGWCSKATIAEAKELCLSAFKDLTAQNQ